MNNLGWECPKCHNCYAPSKLECTKCNGQHIPPAHRVITPGPLPPKDNNLPGPTSGENHMIYGYPEKTREGVSTPSYAEMMGITIANKLWPDNVRSYGGWTETINGSDVFVKPYEK